MRDSFRAPLCAVVILLVATSCQHRPPERLDLAESLRDIQLRSLDAEPVQAFAQRLVAKQHTVPQAFNPADGVALVEAEAIALAYNADIHRARLTLRHAAERAGLAGRWEDPALSAEPGRKRFNADGPGGVERSWINAASLSITLPLSGRPQAEAHAASAEAVVALAALAETEWVTLQRLHVAWIRWSATIETLDLLDQHIAVLARFAQVASALDDAGELSPGSARLFAIELARKEAQRARAEAEAESLRLGLLGELGLLADAPATLLPMGGAVPLVSWPEGEPSAHLASTHPGIARLRAAYLAREAQLRVELRKQYPDVTLSPGITREPGETGLVLGMGMPVPVWNANRAGIAEAVAARDIARAEALAAYQQALLLLRQRQTEHAGAAAQRTRLAEEIAPLVDTQLAEAEALLAMGEIDVVLIYEALTQAFDLKSEIIAASLDERIAAIELNALATPPVVTTLAVEELQR